MFRELRLQYGYTQQQVADATGRTPGYVLKAEDLTFPAPSPALLDFYREQDPSLTVEFLTSWYKEEQLRIRKAWLEEYLPTGRSALNFRTSWVSYSTRIALDDPYLDTDLIMHPTQYRLSKGLCIPAAVCDSMERYPMKPMPRAVGFIMDQLLDYTKSGSFQEVGIDTGALVDALLRLKADFS